MINALQDFFQREGFRGIGYSGGIAFYKMYVEEMIVVQLVAQETIALLDADRLMSQRLEFENTLRIKNNIMVPIRFLTLVVIDNEPSEYFKELSSGIKGFWMASERKEALIVYENQSLDYHGLYDDINAFLASGVIKEIRSDNLKMIKDNLQPVTVSLLVLNIVIYLYATLHGDVMSANYMFSIGAITWDSILVDHQYFRLITAAFLHYGFEHLSSNMISLLGLGIMLEKRIGHVRFLVLYMLCAVLANITSVAVSYIRSLTLADYYAVSAGASGAIFGVIGGLIGVVLLKKRWAKNKADFIDISLRSILTMAFFSVFAGFSGGGVDNAAHVGGLLSGFVIALLLAIKP